MTKHPAVEAIAGALGRSGSVESVEGTAAYAGFREAGVSTQEDIRLPSPPSP